MSVNKMKDYEKKNKSIIFRVTKLEFERYQRHKSLTSSSSPTLTTSDILRKVISQIDDDALLYFLYLANNDIDRIRFRQAMQMMKLDNK